MGWSCYWCAGCAIIAVVVVVVVIENPTRGLVSFVVIALTNIGCCWDGRYTGLKTAEVQPQNCRPKEGQSIGAIESEMDDRTGNKATLELD